MASKNAKELRKEIGEIKGDLAKLSAIKSMSEAEADPKTLLSFILAKNERTDKILMRLSEQLQRLEEDIRYEPTGAEDGSPQPEELVGLSNVDVAIVNFLQTRHNEMTCAKEIAEHMGYSGKNAACARLKRLESMGLVKRLQLGHIVYYKFYADKTTKTLIVSPPQ